MNIPTSDIELKKKIRTLCTVRRKNLWKELFEIASYFTLLGAPDLALSLLRFAYSNVISQEDNRSSIHILTDAVIAAICLNQGAEDLSKQYPPPTRYVDHAKMLPQRVGDWELHVRQTLTVGAYSANLNWDKLPKLAMLVKAKLLAQPGDDYELPTRMQESLNLLNEFLADVCPPRQEPASYEALQALILAADIAASLGHEDQTRDYLQRWFYFERLGKNGVSCCDPLILRTLSNLIYSGILSNHSKLTREAMRELINEIIQVIESRKDEIEPAAPGKHTISIAYNQFHLEPLTPTGHAVYFQESGEFEQGFSCFDDCAAVSTPNDTDECIIQVEIKSRMPDVSSAQQAVVFPMAVKAPGELYLRTPPNYDDADHKVKIAEGNYDILACFYPLKPKRDYVGNRWKVILTFLPAGTHGAACFKLLHGNPPDKALVHNAPNVL